MVRSQDMDKISFIACIKGRHPGVRSVVDLAVQAHFTCGGKSVSEEKSHCVASNALNFTFISC